MGKSYKHSPSNGIRSFPTYNLNHDPIYNSIYTRMHYNDQNFMMAVTGGTGAGKSGCAISESIMIDVDNAGYTRWYYYDKKGDIHIPKVVFTASEFLKLIRGAGKSRTKLPVGSMIIWDEAGVEQDATMFMSAKSRLIKWILQTYRNLNLGLLLTVPHLQSIQIGTRRLLHAHQQVLDVEPSAPFNRNTARVTKFLWRKDSMNGKEYSYRQMCYEKDAGNHLYRVDKHIVPAPPGEVYKAYNEKKNEQLETWYKDVDNEIDIMYKAMGVKNKGAEYYDVMSSILSNPSECLDEDTDKFKKFLIEHKFPDISQRLLSKVTQTLNFYNSKGKMEELEDIIVKNT